MPELPEVECVRRSLQAAISGGFVAGATLLRRDICESRDAQGRLVRTRAEHLLSGSTIDRVERLGKQLALIAANGRVLCVHLGMTGQLLVRRERSGESDVPRDHVHARWAIRRNGGSGEACVIFRDPRRFGGLWTFESLDQLKRSRWRLLGPDALTIRAEELHEALRDRTCSIKAALLDQGTLAGVGNIYADEALFSAGISPGMCAGRIHAEQVTTLASHIRETLALAIESGGSTLRDYRDASGSRGTFQHRHAVYGRAGEPCLRCGGALRRATIAQRTTVYCPACQPRSPNR